ncbi:uncharacterized protein [Triticum aestivum]|uniref:uncharacterized protein n=1 Tax=Triticum aestivum TaxID=4565 RepID=UPI0008430B27|nr:uncharacterized protein LOC123107188 [Triticum aestivum]
MPPPTHPIVVRPTRPLAYSHRRRRLDPRPRHCHNGLDIHATNWKLDSHSDVIQANYHVHLCIESIPLNSWSDSVAAQVPGPNTFVHYFDVATLRQEDASCLRLWAWSADPSAIPKVQNVTIAPRVATGVGGAPSSAIGHRGSRRRAIVHLDRIEDYTPDAAGNIPRRPLIDPFTWRFGVVDGEDRARDRHEPPPRHRDDDERHRRDDDRDREDRRGRDNDRSRSSTSWRDRFFRSRSRAPERRADEDRQDSRREDRGRYGRRRARNGSLERAADGGPAEGRARGRSLPPSPRTTSSDVIEIATSAYGWGWLCGTAGLVNKVQPSLTLDDRHDGNERLLPTQDVLATPAPTPTSPSLLLWITTTSSTPEFVLATPTPPRLELQPEDNSFISNCRPASNQQSLEAEHEANSNSSNNESPTVLSDRPEQLEDEEAVVTPIFIPRMPALLPTPAPGSTPPRRPTTRRKTLAGVSGFQLQRQSPRLRAKKRKMPIAKLAEQLLCRRMGIVADGQQVTEEAIVKFAEMFQGRLPDMAVAALRALFQLDCDLASAVEDALIQHGGEGGPDLSEPAAADA